MPLKDSQVERETFFVEPTLDLDLPFVNRVFWSSLIKHIEHDCVRPPRAIVDIGCHTGGLLYELNRQFAPAQLIGI